MKRNLSVLLAGMLFMGTMPVYAEETSYVYAKMNIPFGAFYGTLNDGTPADAVSSATITKASAYLDGGNVYGETTESATNLNGIVFPVKMTEDDYKVAKAAVDAENGDYYLSDMIETPLVYMDVDYNEGAYVFSPAKGETSEETIEASLSMSSPWGDYQISLADKEKGIAPENVYGVYVTMTDGTSYGLRQGENTWNPHNMCEFAWSTGHKVAEPHGNQLHHAHYADTEGKTVSSITFLTTDGIVKYSFANPLYLKPFHKGSISMAILGQDKAKVIGIPNDLENPMVTITYSAGRRDTRTVVSTTPANDTGIYSPNNETGEIFKSETVFMAMVESDNYAPMTATASLLEGDVFALVNIPFDVFYKDLNNDVDVDAVTSATIKKASNYIGEGNVYGTVTETEAILQGIIAPVKMDKEVFANINAGDNSAPYAIVGVLSDSNVYFEGTYDTEGNLSLSNLMGEENVTENIEAAISIGTAWGDYEIDLANTDMGKTPSDVYGVYMTTEDGFQYALRQGQNTWNPRNMYEFAVSAGHKLNEPHGNVLDPAHYTSLEGKTIVSLTYITKTGIETYKFVEPLYAKPFHAGEIKAFYIDEKNAKISGIPEDLQDVTIDIYYSAGRRDTRYVAQNAAIHDGIVTGNTDLTFENEIIYTVKVNSSNFAPMTTTFTTLDVEPTPTDTKPTQTPAYTGFQLNDGTPFAFLNADEALYWYEDGIRQGIVGDPKNIFDNDHGHFERGREIYDPNSKAWYWLDANAEGAVAKNKEVWMPYVYQGDNDPDGKWVRYDRYGQMIKGWYANDDGIYYYDPITGQMYKGTHVINNKTYFFDTITGIRN